MKKKPILITILILLAVAAAALCFAQARSNPSGRETTDAQSAVSEESEPSTVDEEKYSVVESSDENTFMRITVPKDWSVKKEKDERTYSMIITPKGSKGYATLTCYTKGGFGVCGTGLTTESILDGEGSVGFYDNEPSWSYIWIRKADAEFVTCQHSLSAEECDAVRSIIENGVYGVMNTVDSGLAVSNIKYTRVAWSEEGEEIFWERSAPNDYRMLGSKRALPTVVIKSKEELDSLIKETENFFRLAQSTSGESFVSVAEQYGKDFFSDKFLLITYVSESSGSVTHSVESVSTDGNNLEIHIHANEPPIGTSDMASWLISMEIPKEEIRGITGIHSWE